MIDIISIFEKDTLEENQLLEMIFRGVDWDVDNYRKYSSQLLRSGVAELVRLEFEKLSIEKDGAIKCPKMSLVNSVRKRLLWLPLVKCKDGEGFTGWWCPPLLTIMNSREIGKEILLLRSDSHFEKIANSPSIVIIDEMPEYKIVDDEIIAGDEYLVKLTKKYHLIISSKSTKELQKLEKSVQLLPSGHRVSAQPLPDIEVKSWEVFLGLNLPPNPSDFLLLLKKIASDNDMINEYDEEIERWYNPQSFRGIRYDGEEAFTSHRDYSKPHLALIVKEETGENIVFSLGSKEREEGQFQYFLEIRNHIFEEPKIIDISNLHHHLPDEYFSGNVSKSKQLERHLIRAFAVSKLDPIKLKKGMNPKGMGLDIYQKGLTFVDYLYDNGKQSASAATLHRRTLEAHWYPLEGA